MRDTKVIYQSHGGRIKANQVGDESISLLVDWGLHAHGEITDGMRKGILCRTPSEIAQAITELSALIHAREQRQAARTSLWETLPDLK